MIDKILSPKTIVLNEDEQELQTLVNGILNY